MAIGQMADVGSRFASRFSRNPTSAEWYLLGRHGLDGVSGMMANPGVPAWVAAFRSTGMPPPAARDAVWSHLPPAAQARFPSGVNGMTSDAYLGLMHGLPYAYGSNGWMPQWGALGTSPTQQPNRLNALMSSVMGAARSGVSGGNAGAGGAGGASAYGGPASGSIWPWGPGGGGSASASGAPAPGMNGLSAALGGNY